MKGRTRAALLANAHHLSPTVHLGAQGITEPLVQSLDDALRARELVKVKVGKGSGLSVREAAAELADRVRGEVIQVIRRTFTLYRERPAE